MTYYAYPGTIDTKFIPANMTHEIRVQYAQQIIHTVCKYYGVPTEAIMTKTRTQDLIKAVQVSTYLIKTKMPSISLKDVSKQFGNRYYGSQGHDHSSIIYNMEKVRDLLDANDSIVQDIDKLFKLL